MSTHRTRSTVSPLALGAIALLTASAAPALAQDGRILQPVGASTSYSVFVGSMEATIDQSGIAAYTSGVTDYDSYIGAASQSGLDGDSALLRTSEDLVELGGTMTFDLGSERIIDRFALWSGDDSAEAIKGFSLYSDADDDFSNGTTALLGEFTGLAQLEAQSFAFDPARTRYIHLEVTDHSGTNVIRIGEVAFRAAVASEAPILRPGVATTSLSLPFGTTYGPVNLTNQSGLTRPFVSDYTDFDAFVASASHAGPQAAYLLANSNGQNQPNGVVNLGETITLDLGTTRAIDAMGFWNDLAGNEGVTACTLYADDDADFSNGTTRVLGAYVTATTRDAQTLAFDAVRTRYVHLEITGHGGGNFVRVGEIAFRKGTVLCACDWNADGSRNDQDFFDFANDYFGQTGPRGHADYNDDGFANDQDFFDFVNCYFNPPFECQGVD